MTPLSLFTCWALLATFALVRHYPQDTGRLLLGAGRTDTMTTTTRPEDMLQAAFMDLTTGEAIFPEQQDSIANVVADAIVDVKRLRARCERLESALRTADEGMAEVHASPMIDGSDLPRILSHARGVVRAALSREAGKEAK